MPQNSFVLLISLMVSGLAYADHARSNRSNDGFMPAAFYVPGKGLAAESAAKASPTQIITNSSIEFLLVPGGEYSMGSENGDDDEFPLRKERIRGPLYFSKYEVTQGQWEHIMGTRPWVGRGHVKIGKKYPAVYINWLEAREFMARLNKRENCTCYRLPTEAEWEYAARAGTRSQFSFGNDIDRLGHYGWFADNAAQQQFAHQVGLKQENPWGLYDMHGNVWEWVSDWHDEDLGPRIRGGSWGSPASSLRSANRSAAPAGRQTSNIGFRVIREAKGLNSYRKFAGESE